MPVIPKRTLIIFSNIKHFYSTSPGVCCSPRKHTFLALAPLFPINVSCFNTRLNLNLLQATDENNLVELKYSMKMKAFGTLDLSKQFFNESLKCGYHVWLSMICRRASNDLIICLTFDHSSQMIEGNKLAGVLVDDVVWYRFYSNVHSPNIQAGEGR